MSTMSTLSILLVFIMLHSSSVLDARRIYHPPISDTQDCQGTSIFQDLSTKFTRFEPSDMVWDSRQQLLYVVSDGGDIAAVDFNGDLRYAWSLGKEFDLEGVAIVNVNDIVNDGGGGGGMSRRMLYVGTEYPARIIELDLSSSSSSITSSISGTSSTNALKRHFNLQSQLTQIQSRLKGPSTNAGRQNSGLESLLFFPSHSSQEGGYFLVGDQLTSTVLIYSVPLTDANSTVATFVTSFIPPIPDTMKSTKKNKKKGEEQPGMPVSIRDLSAMTLYQDRIYFMWDTHQLITSMPVSSLPLPPTPISPSSTDFVTPQVVPSETITSTYSLKKHLPSGWEALSIASLDEYNTYVFMGLDQSKKKGDKKDLRRWHWSVFERCFAGVGDDVSGEQGDIDDDDDDLEAKRRIKRHELR